MWGEMQMQPTFLASRYETMKNVTLCGWPYGCILTTNPKIINHAC